MTPQDINANYIADLYGETYLAEDTPARTRPIALRLLFPGLVVVAMASAAATWFSEHYGMPVILAGLLIGLALNFISAEQKVHPGLDFCGTSCLRWGIVLLGTQVTVMQIGSLGAISFVGLVFIMCMVVASGLLGARLAGQSNFTGWLAGGATAICGASAALAIYAIVGRERLNQSQFTLTLVGVALASAIAMSFYPIIADYLQFTDRQAGFLMGAAVHDVAQSLGGGYSFSQEAGEVATIVKLSRVALLAPAVALIGLAIGSADGSQRSLMAKFKLPWFILAFFAAVAANSLIEAPIWVREYGLVGSKAMLLFAVTATAMRSRLDLLLSQGWRALAPVMIATVTAFILSCGFAWAAL
ncbi:MAG: putative sulfate exporter family transporter [Sphingorhabdus sp.]